MRFFADSILRRLIPIVLLTVIVACSPTTAASNASPTAPSNSSTPLPPKPTIPLNSNAPLPPSPSAASVATAAPSVISTTGNPIQIKEIGTLTGHEGFVNSVAFSPDGKTLASSSRDGAIKLWDVATQHEIRTLKGKVSTVPSIAFSPDGKTLAAGACAQQTGSRCPDGIITLWDISSGNELRTLKGHSEMVVSVAYSPDGKTIASGARDNMIKIWDVDTGQELGILTGHTGWIFSVAFSPDGKTLASSSLDHTIRLWDVKSGQELRQLTGQTPGWAHAVVFSPDGKTLFSGGCLQPQDACTAGGVLMWDVTSGQVIHTLPGHTNAVISIALSPNGSVLASAAADKTVKIWDTSNGQELTTLNGHTEPINAVSFSPVGDLLASGSADKTIKLWAVP
jgi:WD40 repeat protein